MFCNAEKCQKPLCVLCSSSHSADTHQLFDFPDFISHIKKKAQELLRETDETITLLKGEKQANDRLIWSQKLVAIFAEMKKNIRKIELEIMQTFTYYLDFVKDKLSMREVLLGHSQNLIKKCSIRKTELTNILTGIDKSLSFGEAASQYKKLLTGKMEQENPKPIDLPENDYDKIGKTITALKEKVSRAFKLPLLLQEMKDAAQ
eukprot:TRINITY_DN5311_c0_g1_i1.p2 TRINITY_DN5311_c0_g1~~TRINITY_DN5311_c0_g1_i1.p2  ORF type:complete len:204 (-),score=34.65 TRINITY_DN5311_c0_g1_i1:454-1065(-)